MMKKVKNNDDKSEQNSEKDNNISNIETNGNIDDDMDDFERLESEMAKEIRSQPTNALKTPEEIALAEHERLEQLERARLKRMHGDEEIGGDDLSDDYLTKNQEDSDHEVIDDIIPDEKHLKLKDTIKPVPLGENQEEITSLSPDEDIPFTFVMPSSYSNFKSLLQDQSVERQSLIISRIRACNHISLLPENKEKMKNLYEYMLQRILDLGQQNPVPMEEIDVLVTPMFQLTHQLPDFSASLVKNCIQNMYNRFKDDGKFKSSALFLFIIIPLIWPVSDRRHVVVTPTLLLMGDILSHINLSTPSELIKGILLTNIFINYLKPSKRYASEPYIFLHRVLLNHIDEKESIDLKESNSIPQLRIRMINEEIKTPNNQLAILNSCISLLGEYLHENGCPWNVKYPVYTNSIIYPN